MSGTSMCINVALGKKATQSSLSQWSAENESSRAVSGVMPPNYAFHTSHEPNPWWMVDLDYPYPIDRIVIHNRLDGLQERAKTCRVDISTDGQSWELVHAGQVHFEGGHKGPPLILPLFGKLRARYVRVSLEATEALHLAQLEVFADASIKVKDRFRLPHLPFAGDFYTGASWGHDYRIEGQPPHEITGNLIGLKITPIGRLGNQLIQFCYAIAIAIARRTGLRYIRTLNYGLVNLHEPITIEGITFLPPDAEAPEPGPFLAGDFFFSHTLIPLLDNLTKFEQYYIVQDIIRPHFMKELPVLADQKYDDEISIHIRAGDIFKEAPSGYTQPPLAFYRVMMNYGLEQNLFTRARLVFEDRSNPCVDGLIHFFEERGIPYRLQNGTLVEDLNALIDAPNLVFGFGSFGIAVSLLSRVPATVFCMEHFSDGAYQDMPSVKQVITIRDRDGKFIKPGAWYNTPEQYAMMMEYPDEALEVLPPQ